MGSKIAEDGLSFLGRNGDGVSRNVLLVDVYVYIEIPRVTSKLMSSCEGQLAPRPGRTKQVHPELVDIVSLEQTKCSKLREVCKEKGLKPTTNCTDQPSQFVT